MKTMLSASCILGLCLAGLIAAQNAATKSSIPTEWRGYVNCKSHLPRPSTALPLAQPCANALCRAREAAAKHLSHQFLEHFSCVVV